MSEITIFLASSSELIEDRDQFEIFISRKNDDWRERDVFLRVIRWENFLDAMSSEGLQSEYNKAVEECDIFVMLVQNKVGPFTTEEFDHAFGQFSDTTRPLIYTYFKPSTTRDREDLQSLWAFEDKLNELKHYKKNYETIEGLREDFGNQLTKLDAKDFFTAEKSPRKARPKSLVEKHGVPLQMPPLPEHFVERPEPQNAVKEQLLCDNDKGGTLVVSAIYGLGGIGKSVLASKLTHDPDVQDYFSDGILWVTLGQNPDILPLLSAWIQALGDNDYKPTAIESASSHLRTLLYDKCILLVVDDVWNPLHLPPFRVGGKQSRVMVTTRNARITGARVHSLKVMNEAQSLDLITQKISDPLSKTAKSLALTFAARVGYLPLALELAASQIEEGVIWQDLLEDFQTEVARLETLDRDELSELSADEERRHRSLVACFNLSLKQLSPELLQQFAWLGVVPEDVSLTQGMVETLWQVTARQSGAILRTFWAKSLLLKGVKQADERPSYRMHDLMHDLAQTLLQQPVEPEGEDGLPGLGLTVAAAHGALLGRYREKTTDGQWHTLTDDGYIFAYLTWHMEQAQQPEEIHRLLCASNEAGRNGWYAACDALGQPAGFVNDMGRAWVLAVESYEAAPGETVALLYRYGLMRGSLNSLASNVPAEMVGGLVKEGYWQAAQGLAYAQQAQNPWHRAACISAIAPYMPKALLPEMLKTVGQIKDAAYRSYVLSKLAEHFPEVWTDVLEVIQKIQDRYGHHRYQTRGFPCRELALTRIIKQLPTQYFSTAIDITRQIQDAADKASALSAFAAKKVELWPEALAITYEISDTVERSYRLSELAQHLPNLWHKVLAVIHEIKGDYERSSELSAVAQYLPEALWPEAVGIIQDIKNECSRAIALSAMAQHFPKLWPEALAIVREIEDEYSRVHVLSEMVKHLLPKDMWPEVLIIIREIKDESSRARALREMAKPLPKELWSEMLIIIQEIKDESSRARALREMAKHLSKELWPEVLVIIRGIKDESSRASALSRMAEHQPELWPEALALTRGIEDESSRASALSEMAEHQPELWPEALALTREIKDEYNRSHALIVMAEHHLELWPEAFAFSQEIKDESSRASALSEMAEYLPKELWPKVLEMTRKIKDEDARSSVLITMAEYLPKELWPKVLEMTRKIKDEDARASALSGMAEHLPKELWPKVLEMTRKIKDEDARSSVLITMATYLPEELWPDALEMTRKIKDEDARSSALSGMAEYLPKELWPDALEMTRKIKDEDERSSVLITMATYLPEELWLEVLEMTRKIKDDYNRLNSLSAMAEHLPDLCPEILVIIREIKDEASRSRALRAMTKHLPQKLWSEALVIIREIKDEGYQSRALRAMTKHCPKELWPEALVIIREIKDEGFRARTLSAMAEHWPTLWPEALVLTREIENDAFRSSALHLMTKHLPQELWSDALIILREIKDETSRLYVLRAMRKHLPQELWSDALIIIREIKDEASRSSALCAITQHLPHNLLSEALDIIWEIQDKYFRAQALQSFLPALKRLSIPFPKWAETLDIIAYQNRSELLEALPNSRPIVTRLGDDNTFPAILQAMRDVCQQWP